MQISVTAFKATMVSSITLFDEETVEIIQSLRKEKPPGWLEVHNAIFRNDIASLEREIELLDDVNISNEFLNALQFACFMRNEEIVRIMINTPCIDVNAAGPGSDPALIFACLANEPGTVALLLEKGADISVASRDYGGTPLMIACLNRFPQIAKLILQKMPKNDFARKCEVALQKPRGEEDDETLAIAKILIESGMDMEAKNDALVKASELGYLRMGKLLLENGADVNARVDGKTALHLAAEKGHCKFVSTLVKAGADVNTAEDTTDYTPLIAAVLNSDESSSYFDIAKILLEAGGGDEYCNGYQKRNALEACEKRIPGILQDWIMPGFNDKMASLRQGDESST